jgi:hypothetical protein
MAIDKLSAVTGALPSPAPEGGKEKFAKVIKSETTPLMVRAPAHPAPAAPARPPPHAAHAARVDPLKQVARGIDRLRDAQHRLDHILQVAQSGKTFTPAELLALQAQVYQASNEIDLAGKVVDKATGGVKQILQTQV